MKAKQIVFCTLRDNCRATGGPGGVLYMQKSLLGGKVGGLPCEYRFNMVTLRLGPIKTLVNKWLFRLRFRRMSGAYFFTHDIETGELLSVLGKKYSLLYHHQGPIIQELTNFGKKLGDNRRKRLARMEREALTHARTLHFPSNGAAEMYFSGGHAACGRDEVNLGRPLYNTIPSVCPAKPAGFELDCDESRVTLFSLGTLTAAKGQDLTVRFIHKHMGSFSRPLRYVLVGKGPLKGRLLSELESMRKEDPSFVYHYYESLPHETVMFVHKISDVYIMLHRVSVFDFATLEAMSQRSAVILSKVGGNLDFNVDSNVIFAEDVEADGSMLGRANLPALKERNYDVFCTRFSKEAFVSQYEEFFEKVLAGEA